MNVESDSYNLFRQIAALPFPKHGLGRMPAPMRSPCSLYDESYYTGTGPGVQINISLELDRRRVLRSLGQDSSGPYRNTCTWARGEARHHDVHGRCRIPCEVHHGEGVAEYLPQQQQQLKKQEIRACDLIPSYHTGGSTVVLLAAEPKRPLTLVRPCVRCCPALWAWCFAAARFVRAAKAPRSG